MYRRGQILDTANTKVIADARGGGYAPAGHMPLTQGMTPAFAWGAASRKQQTKKTRSLLSGFFSYCE